jgi:hypothetical protein
MGVETLAKVRSHDLVTRFVLVDFEGGAKLAYRSGVTSAMVREDIPAEILVLEPNGRLFARSVLADRDLEERKVRFNKWKQWYDTVKEKVSRNKPKDEKKDEKERSGQKPQGG